MNVKTPRILPSGDAALTVEFGQTIDLDANGRVLSLDRLLEDANIAGVIETVPTYRSLLVHYDPVVIGFDALSDEVQKLAKLPDTSARSSRRWRIPVVYGGAYGVDLDDVARTHGLTTGDIIARHTANDYLVAMIGFTPGFAYLSGLDPTIMTPRRKDPRIETPSGTISIGGSQACVQCLAGPSGWHLLGRTPVRTFYTKRDPIFLLDPGDIINFYEVPAKEFDRLDQAADRGDLVAELIAS